MTNQELLISLTRRFLNLMDHPEPGLLTWHLAVQELVDQIAKASARLTKEQKPVG